MQALIKGELKNMDMLKDILMQSIDVETLILPEQKTLIGGKYKEVLNLNARTKKKKYTHAVVIDSGKSLYASYRIIIKNKHMKTKVIERKYLLPFILITRSFRVMGIANDITNPMVAAFKTIMEIECQSFFGAICFL